ncbi:MAG TPA: right-handed parallel beta-helix repeat-containing protein, partial [Pirellulaceae bacterium]|nr:right-handed parallel beta-helix repeat-containing protein [Pirellulaceae bacterium]
AANRAIGLRIGDAGQDATFTNNTLTNNSTGMFLNGLSDGADANTVPVVASGNNFAGSDTPLQIQGVAGQFIGTSGVGIIINNATDGVANAASQSIRLQNVSGMTINGIDASYTGVGRAGTGVYADGTNNNLTITGVNAANRGVGLRIGDAGQDATFTNNTLTNNSLGLFLNGQSDGADANTVPVVGAGNNFAGSDTAIQMQGIAGQFVGTTGTGLIVNNATDGMQSAVSIGIRMANVTNMTIDGVDLSFNGARRTGTGIYLDGTNNNLAIRNVNTDKRSLGLRLGDAGQDLIVENNQLTNNDLGLFISGYTDGADANTSAFTGSGNRFTGAKDAIYIQGMASTLVIGNSDVAGVNFSIDASSDLTSAYGAAISLNNASNVTIDGVDLSLRGLTRNGTGINARSTPNNFVLKNSSVINRSTGLLYNPDSTAASNTAKVSNSDFINNDVGISLTQHVAGGFVNGNRIEANGTGLAYGTGTSTTLDATGNYWGPNSSGAPGTGGNNGVSVSPVSLVTTTGFVATPPSALNRDYGDDPLSYGFSTRIGAFGARHMAAGPQLGALRDSEADAPTTIFANSDDTTGVDDEDGVSIGALTAGASATALVTVSGGASKLDAWIDFNRDGDWNDAGEKIANSLAVVNGVNTITFSVPAGATIGANYARFRLSTQGGLSPDGLASNGEVEDYVAGDAYVDDAWSGPSFPNGTAIADADPVAAGAQPAIIGLNAFSSVAAALNAAASGGLGRIIVNAGDYSADAAMIAHSGLVLRFQEGNSTVGGLDDSVTDASIVLAGVTLTVGVNNASTQLDSPISGAGSLVKAGTGTLALAAAETYSGSTTINGGSLALSMASNNNLASPTITVASGATLNVAGLASSRFDRASGQTLQGVG